MEQRLARRMGPLVKKETCYPSLIPLDVWLVGQETREACFAEGKRRLFGLGWEEGRLGEDGLGWGHNWQGEGLPIKLVQKYTRRHRDVMETAVVSGVDKDKMTESELRKIICSMESGPKIVEECVGGGEIQRFVSVLCLGPHGVTKSIEKRRKPEQTSAAESLRGVEVEVNLSLTFTDCKKTLGHFSMTIFPGTWACLWA